MDSERPTVAVTGVSGHLGLHLLPKLGGFSVLGIDVQPPQTDRALRFVRMDLGREESCRELYHLLRETHAVAVIHLAFVLDQVRMGVLDLDRMWQINVAGTARVMEAITEVNRDQVTVEKFIFPSSVAAYGPSHVGPVAEDSPLAAHTYPYGVHKKQCDEVVQQRAPSLRACSVYILRPHIYAGRDVDNYLLGIFRGTPNGKSKRARKMRTRGERLPCLLPWGQHYLENRLQYVHIDDVARLISYILRREPEARRVTILNVAGRGEPLTLARCVEMSNSKLIRVPGRWASRLLLTYAWKRGLSAIPPEIEPYMNGECIMNTDRLRAFLGHDYDEVIRYTVEDAFAESLEPVTAPAVSRSAAT
ncbi:MAG: NAD-dependent epimerase/dehydratase family protein [Acidobacteria bacterium]|nr:NAD-dependent epimerase/dehydratase family protein [Acidobacteriota bacterium]